MRWKDRSAWDDAAVIESQACYVRQGPPNERMQLTWLTGAPSQAGLG